MTTTIAAPLGEALEQKVVAQLAALAQTTRLALFRELIKTMDCGAGDSTGLAAGELARRLDLAAPNLSFHLKELTRAGLIRADRKGRSMIYSVNGREIRSLIDFMLEDCCSQCC